MKIKSFIIITKSVGLRRSRVWLYDYKKKMSETSAAVFILLVYLLLPPQYRIPCPYRNDPLIFA